MKRRAFTLVELLVVIAIIGLLTAIASVSMSVARKSSRNAKRISDVKALSSAFYMAYDKNGYYPSHGGGANNWACVSQSCGGGWGFAGANASVDAAIFPAYLGTKPDDPAGSERPISGYIYNNVWGGDSGFGMIGGTVIVYGLEGSVSCGPGKIYIQTSAYTQCAIYLPL
jgi:prepilin-type N-terminal cleavage/methylation domain-containing protein